MRSVFMTNKLFIKSKSGELYEGPMSDKTIKILFVMKEPNGPDLTCFWMKNVVHNINNERIGNGIKYYNVLGEFAKHIIGKEKQASLEESAYINLYPFDGKAESTVNFVTGKSYKDLNKVKVWKEIINLNDAKAITKQSTNKDILSNRLRIIKDALEDKIVVVAHYEIVDKIVGFSVLKDDFKKTAEFQENKYHIASYEYKNKTKLYAAPHPSRVSNAFFEIISSENK